MSKAVLLMVAAGLLAAADAPAPRWDAAGDGNPLLPGYFADPSIVRDGGKWYIYATIDPWGADTLGMWTSANGRDWTFSTPAWPTKAAATSPTSGDSKVWAPSVVKAKNGRWYMYVSVGSEVWVGSAPSPAGPWADAHGGKPLIAKGFAPAYHMIDAEAFVDDDGTAYLYWGSGLNWTNGHCFVVKLKPDMVSFDGEPKDVTPANYFEGPFLVKAGRHYVLTYSDGKTTEDTYKVRYAIGDTPLGPFREGPDSPILSTDKTRDVISPGHHAIFRVGSQPYILYHRQSLPWPRPGDDATLRQIAVDPLTIHEDGSIAKVTPSHGSAVTGFVARRTRGLPVTLKGAAVDVVHAAERAGDDNYATLWRPAPGAAPLLVADLGKVRTVRTTQLRMEYAHRSYDVAIEASVDGTHWRQVAAKPDASGSPIALPLNVSARYLRLRVPAGAGVWEWQLF
ncbi:MULTISPECIES: family 43 glycosylhydrolase [Sphingomonas]|uniref:Beta-xylosidase n=1 Tax=Sphingomonas trueperi TaxID=53317 RepID=A0A7X5XXW2_9SPHN|nr:family 43 glycosylhydrolase [Sphingomonas sp. ABOLD]NJB97003.1 beta-xylosidase [Sphingomonas trueperi]